MGATNGFSKASWKSVYTLQEAANHHGVRTSPLVAWRRTLAPPWLAATPPPARAGEVAGVRFSKSDGQPHHQCISPRPLSVPPPLRASPSPGVDGARRGGLQDPPPRLPTSPTTGVAGRLAGTHTLPDPSPTLHSPGQAL
jgi:hypothetical protein